MFLARILWPLPCNIILAESLGGSMSQNEIKYKIKNQSISFSLILGLVTFISSIFSPVYAAIERRGLSDQLIADFYAVKAYEKTADASQVIPLDMVASSDQSLVFSRLADRGLNSFMNSDSFKGSQFGRTTSQMQEELQTEITVGGEEPESTQHKFNLNFEVFQAMAKMTYSGFTNLTIRYKPVASELNFEIAEKLDESKDLVFDHLASSDLQLSQVSVRWTF